jgi:hypothetical protein
VTTPGIAEPLQTGPGAGFASAGTVTLAQDLPVPISFAIGASLSFPGGVFVPTDSPYDMSNYQSYRLCITGWSPDEPGYLRIVFVWQDVLNGVLFPTNTKEVVFNPDGVGSPLTVFGDGRIVSGPVLGRFLTPIFQNISTTQTGTLGWTLFGSLLPSPKLTAAEGNVSVAATGHGVNGILGHRIGVVYSASTDEYLLLGGGTTQLFVHASSTSTGTNIAAQFFYYDDLGTKIPLFSTLTVAKVGDGSQTILLPSRPCLVNFTPVGGAMNINWTVITLRDIII